MMRRREIISTCAQDSAVFTGIKKERKLPKSSLFLHFSLFFIDFQICLMLFAASVEQDHKEAFDDNFEVEPQAAFLYVFEVELDPIVEG